MNKELQNKAWHVLPAEFKEEVKAEYHRTSIMYVKGQYELGILHTFETLFGHHNLDSYAEGEEMLTITRKAVMLAYEKCCRIKATKYDVGYADCLYNLFGSKCLPDETPLSQNPPENCDNANHISNKPAEPKFKVGDKVIYDDAVHIIVGMSSSEYFLSGYEYAVKGSDLTLYDKKTKK